jgi:two-component system, NtrC family, nitrogen regulation sensor histidine kinase NtrY
MSLRTKLLCFFGLLAVLPLIAMGILHYVQSMRTVEAHIVAQVELIAERAAEEVVRRHEVHVSDLLLLAENAETQRLFLALAAGREREAESARESAVAYLAEVWQQIGSSYSAVELRDLAGDVVLELGDRPAGHLLPGPGGGALGARPASGPTLEQPIVREGTSARLGTVVAEPRLAELLPAEALDARFGAAGMNLVLDRSTGQVVHSSRGARMAWGPAATPELGFDPAGALFAAPAGQFRYHHSDSTRLAAFVNLAAPPWTVISVATLEEFSGPFERMRMLNLAAVLVVILLVSLGSVLLVRRATRSLEELTAAAGDVARGDFVPALPPAGADEVGRLSAAFATMVDRIRDMIAQLQASRQMAAVGEFASELAHEIRNPLTSVKLNLQRIDRAVRASGGPADAAAPLRIALREVARLERVVRGVLDLGRPRPLQRRVVSLHEVARDAVEVIRPEAEALGAVVETGFDAGHDLVLGDRDQLRAALLNLLLNGLEAMPEGGVLGVRTVLWPGPWEQRPAIELVVQDTGPGVPDHVREQLFRPFFTTKPGGTGLGLAVALRTAEEHGGALELAEPGEQAGAGASFRLVLPLLPSPVHAGAVS